MSVLLQVLVLEDSKADYELLLHELRCGGYEPVSTRVETAEDMKDALVKKAWDIIIADYAMPQFDAMDALKIIHKLELDIPFIIVSGTIGEDVAVEAMKAGAHDYFMKDKLARLCAAVGRKLSEAEVRRDRRKDGEKLIASEIQYRRLFESAKDGILILDARTGTIVDVNPYLIELLGYSHEQFLEKRIWELGFLKDIIANQANFEKLKNKKYIRYKDLPLETSYGQQIAVEFVSNIYEVNGHEVIQCNIRDNTERNQAEQRTQLAHEVLDLLNRQEDGPDLIRDILLLIRKNTGFEALGIRLREGEDFPYYESNGFPDAFIKAEQYLCSRDNAGELIRDSEGHSYLECMCGNIICGRTDPSKPFFTKGGSFWTNSTSKLIALTKEKNRLACTRNRCNREGYESVALIPLRAEGKIIGLLQLNDSRPNCFTKEMIRFFEGIGASIGITLSRSYVNQELRKLSGDLAEWVKEVTCLYGVSTLVAESEKSLDEILKEMVRLLSPAWHYPEIACARINLDNREFVSDNFSETPWKLSAGITASGKKLGSVEVFYLEDRPVLDEGPFLKEERDLINDLARQLGVMVERRKAEEERKRILDLSNDLICITGMDGYFKYVNPACQKVLGYSEEELLSTPFLDLIHPDDHPANDAAVAKLTAGEIPGTFENRYIHKNGSICVISWRITPLPEMEQMYCVGRDITERKQLEEQLHQAMKMEAIGRLAGGVAHDFNNALTPLLAISDILLTELGPGHLMYKDIREIQESGQRCASLTHQLLAFGRRQPMKLIILNLNDVIVNIEKMLSRVIGEDIELVKFLEPKLGSIKADIGQIEQIIANLVVNARDAMPNGGKLSIETNNVTLDKEYSQSHVSVVPGHYVMLAVSDTGTGMDAETRAHIFEPFYTTKEKDKGTGLGLSTVFGIVKQSGGNIWAYSEPGKGTTFKIYLPCVEEEVKKIPIQKQVPVKSYQGSETVMIVEDDDGVRKVVWRILSRKGYNILEAGNGKDAIKLSRSYKETIHLLVTDVIMPGMNGRELAKRLLTSRPGIKILYISGYTDNTIVHHGILDQGVHFLQKPFDIESLAAKVREVLDNDC